MMGSNTSIGAALPRAPKFGKTTSSDPTDTAVTFHVDVTPDIHVRHTTTVGDTTQQSDVAVKGHVHIDSDDTDTDTPHPMLAFCQHLLHKVTQKKTKPSKSPTPDPSSEPQSRSPLQQLMHELSSAFAQLKGKLRLDLDIDASQLTQQTPGATKGKKSAKPAETVLIPEAGVSGVKGKLNLNVPLKQAQELLTVVQALNHPERCDDTRAAIRSVMYKELSFLEWIQLGLSHLFFAKKWRQSIIRKALEAKLNKLLPKSSLTLYRPTMQPPVTVNTERTPDPMTNVPAIRFGTTDAVPPHKPNEPQTFPLVPPTPPDTFVLSYQANSGVDVAVDHRQRTTNGSFTHDATGDEKPEGDETTAHTIRHHNDGTTVAVRVNGPVVSELNVAGSNGEQGLHGRGNLTINVGEQKPFHVGVGVVTDTEVLHDNNAQQPFRQVVSDKKLTVDLSGLQDHTGVTVTPTALDADLKTQLKSGTIVYTSRGQRNGLQDAVQNAGADTGGVVLQIGDEPGVTLETDPPTPTPVRERSGTQRQVTILLGDAATLPVVKKDGDDKPQPAPQPVGPLQVGYTVAGTRVKQEGSSEVNGTVKANVAVPFRVETANSSITFTNPEQTQAQVDQTQSRGSSTTTGHVKLDGTGKLRLVLPQLPPPPPPVDGSTGSDGTPPGSGGGGGSNPLAALGSLLNGQISLAIRQVMGTIQQQQPTTTDTAAQQPGSVPGGDTGNDTPQS